MSSIVFQDNNLTITISERYDQEFIDFVEGTVWGTHGLMYTMHDLRLEFDQLNNPRYATISTNQTVVGVCLVNRKEVLVVGEPITAFYLCVLSVKPEYRGNGYGRQLVSKLSTYLLEQTDGKALVYAYVEDDNERSLRLFEKSGFERIGGFIVPVFSRLNPKMDSGLIQLESPEEKLKMARVLLDYYDGHALADYGLSIHGGDYFALKDNGDLVAGLQAKRFRWTFLNMPNLDGFLMMRVIPKLPVLKKLINPGRYEFLKIGNVYIKEGYEKRFIFLMESVLASHSLCSCMAYFDPQSGKQSRITSLMKSGILSSADTKGSVLAKGKGVELERLRNSEMNISMLDSI